MHGDDVHETREINGLWIRDSDYRLGQYGHTVDICKILENQILFYSHIHLRKTISMLVMLIKPSNKNSENHGSWIMGLGARAWAIWSFSENVLILLTGRYKHGYYLRIHPQLRQTNWMDSCVIQWSSLLKLRSSWSLGQEFRALR